MKKIKVLNSILFATMLGLTLTSCETNPSTIASIPVSNNNESANNNQTTTDPIKFTYEGYYSSLNGHLDGTLRSTLTALLEDTHKTEVTYSQAWNVLEEADEALSDSSKIECIYSNQLIDKTKRVGSNGSAGEWNKEHVWAKTYGFGSESYTAYADCHHLHASDYAINAARGSKYFDNVSSGTESYGCTYNSTAFEVRDDKKGDTARSIFYMYARYNSSTLALDLTEDPTQMVPKSLGTGMMAKLSTLIEWNFSDPVDEKETKRNEVIYNYQGDYNPFIDHPELVYYLFPTECKALGITEDKLGSYVSGNSSVATNPSMPNTDNPGSSTTAPTETPSSGNASDQAVDGTTYSFATHKVTAVYTNDVIETVNGKEFNFSKAYGSDGCIRLGANSKNSGTVDSKYIVTGVSENTNQAILSFNADIEGFSVNISQVYSGLNGCYLLYSADGTNYTLVKSFGALIASSQDTSDSSCTLSATFNKANGNYVLLITGTSPRIDIASVILK